MLRLLWTSLVVLFAALCCGCIPEAEGTPVTGVESAWDDGPFTPYEDLATEPDGRPAIDSQLTVRFVVPPLDGAGSDPALFVPLADSIAHVTVGERTIEPWPLPNIAPLGPDDAGKTSTAVLRGRSRLKIGHVKVGSARAMMARAYAVELPALFVALVLSTLGASLLLGRFAARARAELGWLGLFALSAGLTLFIQCEVYGELVRWPIERWWLHAVCTHGIALGGARFVAEVYGDTRGRALHRGSSLLVLGLAVVLVLDATDVLLITRARGFVYLMLILLFGAALRVVGPRARAGDRTVTPFAVGLGAAVVSSLPDMSAGLGYPILPFNIGQYGMLVFTLSLLFVAQRSADAQSRRIATSERELEKRVAELEDKQVEVESLNAELRVQIEKRSRELREALAGPRVVAGFQELVPGDVVAGRYHVIHALGQGAMGAVYEVTRMPDGRAFALKVMIGAVTASHAARFAREAEIAARVAHPNVVPVVDVGVDERGFLYLVMGLVRGRTLHDGRDRFGDVPWASGILAEVARGLAALHAQGVVHRDLKPSNVLLEPRGGREVARIADFGVAREEVGLAATSAPGSRADALTATGGMIGTPLYMAPEAIQGTVGRAADVFALGIIACELFGGTYPFRAAPILSALGGLPAQQPELPASLSGKHRDLVIRMLDWSPDERPSAERVAAAFADDEVVGGEPRG
jgi:hypothetical protein